MSVSDFDTKVQNAIAFGFQFCVFIFEPWIIAALWRWYVVPLGVRPIGWATAFGLNALIAVFTFRWPGERTAEENMTAAFATLFTSVFAFCIGWLALKLST